MLYHWSVSLNSLWSEVLRCSLFPRPDNQSLYVRQCDWWLHQDAGTHLARYTPFIFCCILQWFITNGLYQSGWLTADSRFAPSQWEMVLICNVSHWLGANLESALLLHRHWGYHMTAPVPEKLSWRNIDNYITGDHNKLCNKHKNKAQQTVCIFHGMYSIPAWISNYIHYIVWMKLIVHFQISMVQPLKFGNG